jgi:proline dehydrogenase
MFSKPSTDRCYDTAVTTLITTMASQLASSKPHMALSVIFGTHNPESCSLIAESLEKQGLASEVEGKKGLLRLRDDVRGKVFVAQLYGELGGTSSSRRVTRNSGSGHWADATQA